MNKPFSRSKSFPTLAPVCLLCSFTTLLMSALGGFVGGTVARPFQSGVSALLYIDRRMRAEGLDLTLAQAASADPT